MKIKTTFLIIFLAIIVKSYSQETNPVALNASMGADLVSSYLWRAIPQGTAPAIQPWCDLNYKGLSIGAWGSYEFTGNFNELDVYAKYTYSNFSVQFVDLFFPGYPGLDQHYFNFKNETTGHAAELGLSFNGTEKIPVTFYAGMILYGVAIDPKTDDAGSLNRSLYFEVNYLGNFQNIAYNVFAGFTPSSSVLYGTSGFSVFNIGISGKKEIKITDQFAVPMKLTLAVNPVSDKLHLALAISL